MRIQRAKNKKIRGPSKNADGIGLNALLSAHFNINNNNDYKFHNVCDFLAMKLMVYVHVEMKIKLGKRKQKAYSEDVRNT